MPVFKFVVSDKNKSYQIEKDQNESDHVLGKKIGDSFHGDFLGLEGYELEIKGGSDKDGFPMRKDFEGIIRKKIVVKKGIGYKTVVRGKRKRKSIRSNMIAQDIVQINCRVVKAGTKSLEELFPKKSSDENKSEKA